MRPREETQTSVFEGRIFQRVPEADCAGGVGVEEGAVLVGGDGAAYLGLFTDYHALETAGVGEA